MRPRMGLVFPTRVGIMDLGEGQAGIQHQTPESGILGCILPFLPGALHDPPGIGIVQDPSSPRAGHREIPSSPL